MNTFNVKTPDEWKERLYTKTANKKLLRIRPVAVLAATLAVIICISGSALAVRISNAPEYFGSIFLGNQEIANDIYSEKNSFFDSSREDLSLKCKAIAGDNFDVNILFELKSTGEIYFDKNKTYHFSDYNYTLPYFSNESGFGSVLKAIDEHTLEIQISLTAEVNRMIGRSVELHLKNIESFDKAEYIECEFSGRLVIDYRNTVNKLTATENTITAAGVQFKAVEGKISSFNFDFYLEAISGKEIYDSLVLTEEKMLPDTLTLHYADGTSEEFKIKLPPENEDTIFPSVTGARKNYKFHIRLYLRKPINAAKVVSAELNGTELFYKETKTHNY